ncbi:unnamed protein product, partial [Owenia fusiformis]
TTTAAPTTTTAAPTTTTAAPTTTTAAPTTTTTTKATAAPTTTTATPTTTTTAAPTTTTTRPPGTTTTTRPPSVTHSSPITTLPYTIWNTTTRYTPVTTISYTMTSTAATIPPPSMVPINIGGGELRMTGLTILMKGVNFHEDLKNQSSTIFDELSWDVRRFLLRRDHNGGLDFANFPLLSCNITRFTKGSIVAEFELGYDVQYYLGMPKYGTESIRAHVNNTIQSMASKNITTYALGTNGTMKNLTVDRAYLRDVTYGQIHKASACTGNILRCEYGHRCYYYNGEYGCYSMCQRIPFGTWSHEDHDRCYGGTCSLSGGYNTSLTTVCTCNNGFIKLGDGCASVAVVVGILGGIVLILIVILIVCAVRKGSSKPIGDPGSRLETYSGEQDANNMEQVTRRQLLRHLSISMGSADRTDDNFQNKNNKENKEDGRKSKKYNLSDSLKLRLKKELLPPKDDVDMGNM